MTHKLVCAKKFDPAVFMGENWSAVEDDERAERWHEIDVAAISLVTCLKKDEELPTGEGCVKLLKEIKETPYVRLGGRAFLGLWEDQSATENWKEPLTFVFFDGLILKHQNGNRYSLYLSWHDDAWHWYSAGSATLAPRAVHRPWSPNNYTVAD